MEVTCKNLGFDIKNWARFQLSFKKIQSNFSRLLKRFSQFFIFFVLVLPSPAQANLIQDGLRLALISALARQPDVRPAWTSFFLLLPYLLGRWNFARNLNLTQQAQNWTSYTLPELPWLAILLLLAISQPFQVRFWWNKRENCSSQLVQSNKPSR